MNSKQRAEEAKKIAQWYNEQAAKAKKAAAEIQPLTDEDREALNSALSELTADLDRAKNAELDIELAGLEAVFDSAEFKGLEAALHGEEMRDLEAALQTMN